MLKEWELHGREREVPRHEGTVATPQLKWAAAEMRQNAHGGIPLWISMHLRVLFQDLRGRENEAGDAFGDRRRNGMHYRCRQGVGEWQEILFRALRV